MPHIKYIEDLARDFANYEGNNLEMLHVENALKNGANFPKHGGQKTLKVNYLCIIH